MTTPFWCLLIAILLPWLLAGVGDYFRKQELGSIDNKHPRAQAETLVGVGARVYAAQANAWEALPVFATSVFVAHLAGVEPAKAATPALLFIAARLVHPVVYAANLDVLRSLSFFVAAGACIWLFVLAAGA